MDVLTPEQRRRNMQAIKSKGTSMEILLGKALWKKGYRYRKNNKKLIGKPDFTLAKHKIAIFVDSEFFHGKNWKTQRERIKTNTTFWQNKIESNIRRDKIVNKTLKTQGWSVVRFWGEDVKKNIDICLHRISDLIASNNYENIHRSS